MLSPNKAIMKATKLFLCFALFLTSIAAIAQQRSGNTSNANGNCNLGTVTPTSASICAGTSVSLTATPVEFVNCFTDKKLIAGNFNYQYATTAVDNNNNVYLSGAFSGNINIGLLSVQGIAGRDFFSCQI